VADPTELMLADLSQRYADMNVSNAFLRLYVSDARFGRAFASLHERLNGHFESINDRAETTKHYWAENSRQMLALAREVNDFLHSLKRRFFLAQTPRSNSRSPQNAISCS
jgi:hypothetical protein